MLRTSAKVASMADGPAKAAALDHLYQGQSNDCYWHGLFGGIYISHMRLATHEHLIAAEDAADAALGTVRSAELRDLDMDGLAEAYLAEAGQVVTVKPSEGGGIGSWDLRAARHAMASVVRRRPEAYHETLRTHETADRAATGPAGEGGAPASIHDHVMAKDQGLSRLLQYDDHERRTGLVRFLAPGVTPGALATATEQEHGDFRDGTWTVDQVAPGRISLSRSGTAFGQPMTAGKTIRLLGDRMTPELVIELEVHHRGSEPVETRLGLELSIHLLGGGANPSAWYDVAGERTPHDGARQAAGAAVIGYGNDWVGVSVLAVPDPAADAWWNPIETVSNSESGCERAYQGSGLLLSWLVRLEPGESRRFTVRQAVAVARDRAAEEAAAGLVGTGTAEVVGAGTAGDVTSSALHP
jgi:alpha-amylase